MGKNWKHIGNRMYFNHNGHLSDKISRVQETWDRVWGGFSSGHLFLDGIFDHQIANYCDNCVKLCQGEMESWSIFPWRHHDPNEKTPQKESEKAPQKDNEKAPQKDSPSPKKATSPPPAKADSAPKEDQKDAPTGKKVAKPSKEQVSK